MTARPAAPSRRRALTLVMLGLGLVVAATLFPFDFSFDAQVSVADEFFFGGALKARGTDLLIGVDAAFRQALRGKIGELRICRVALTAEQVAKEAQRSLAARAGVGPMHECAASYSFSESSDALLRDESGNRNHGKLVGGPRWIREDGRGALFFNGSGQYVQVPNSPSIDIGGPRFTIAMLVALEDSPSDGVIVVKPWRWGEQADPYYQYGVEFGTIRKTVDFYFADSRGRMRGPFSVHPPVGAWTHIVFVFDGAVRAYVDGREEFLPEAGRPWSLADILGNLLLFLPLGFGLAALMQDRGLAPAGAIALALAVGAMLSLGIEILQCWLPTREPSWIDVVANSVGSTLGAALHFADSSGIFGRSKRFLFDRLRARNDV